ncbi:MAG: branched-chain amino acid ABC transporter substrate-binding protein [Anaerolineae bacterium]|nr:branched-chain amino acid ABC transporter substrate-binding protein [Anaerolineae bacterium]
MRKWAIGAGVVVLAAAIIVGVFLFTQDEEEEPLPPPSTVKVAVAFPLDLEIGQDYLNAVQMALDAAGGKASRTTVELLVLNTSDPDPESARGTADQEAAAAAEAAADPAVVLYIGMSNSGQAQAAIPILNEAGIASISGQATWPGLTKAGFGEGEPGTYYPSGERTFFRVVPSDDIQGVAAARWIARLGFRRVYIVDDGSVYGAGIAGILEASAQENNLQVIGHVQFDPETATAETFGDLAEEIVATQPDIVYIGGSVSEGGGALLGALRTADSAIQIMGADGLIQASIFAENEPGLLEGVYATSVSIPATVLGIEAARIFQQDFQAAHSKDPLPHVINSYETMQVALHAIAQAGNTPTRANVLEAMRNLGTFSGVLGSWQFDANGDITAAPISGWRVQDDEWTFALVVQ